MATRGCPQFHRVRSVWEQGIKYSARERLQSGHTQSASRTRRVNQLTHRSVVGCLSRAQCCEQQDGRSVGSLQDMSQCLDSRRIHPLYIVKEQDQWSERTQDSYDRFEQADAGRLGREGDGWRERGFSVQFWYQLDHSRASHQRTLGVLGVQGSEQVGERRSEA